MHSGSNGRQEKIRRQAIENGGIAGVGQSAEERRVRMRRGALTAKNAKDRQSLLEKRWADEWFRRYAISLIAAES
jgi:hypothetical protein